MIHYATDSRVAVYPFTRQDDGEAVIIGRLDTSTFLALPPDAVELLDHLAEGKTVGEAQSLYHERYGEVPDVADLLQQLESEGFVLPLVASSPGLTSAELQTSFASQSGTPPVVNFHFTRFPVALAQLLFGRAALCLYGLIMLLAVTAAIIDPTVVPGWEAFFVTENFTLIRLLIMLQGYMITALHELGHAIAARSVGVSSRFGISNRLWVLVAETDMTGIWSVPRRQRYLPLLGGALVDSLSASLLTFVVFSTHQGWISMPPFWLFLCRALLLSYLLNLLWQCYFFVRTDFYYVIANFLGCTSLMDDTRVYLRNKLAPLRRNGRIIDQSGIAAREMRAVRWYAVVWIVGRIVAFSVLGLITLPLLWNYLNVVVPVLGRGYSADPYAFIDALILTTFVLVPQGIGLLLWLRSLRTRRS